jgi:predicted ATPase/GAF domain-containing protein/tRNA A-37 threonylcarbamoyl transferase component Bud32
MVKNAIKYQIIEKIYESANSLVYRGILEPEKQPIILKILKENYPSPSELTRYKQEYEITRSLTTDRVIKVYGLQRYQNSLVMILEDFGGQSLNLLMSKRQFSLEEFLTIAIKTTESLADIHKANIIHKDINPANVVYNQKTGHLKIIDFGIATQLSHENQKICHINQLEGTLAYIAPEQTGRMNQGIDYRSDFYALGVTFYEVLTHQLPFTTKDPMELVHCHIAQHPKTPHEQISSIPLTLSNIVIKLLAKTPEDRYQSAWGIKADLEKCLEQLKSQGKIYQFSLGSQDIADKFNIPQKLYGREQEIEQLLNTFERVSQGNTEMILVSGYSGIGKSALVHEIHKPITYQRGYFIQGKFDQLQRDIPYAAITQAFQDLIRQLLSEPDIVLQNWRKKILEALGSNGQIIIDVIPELEKVIGKQPAIDQLGATESQNRFNLFFTRFVNVFSQKEHPLTIFLDDLQWADLPSLNLIEKLMTNGDIQYLLIIGAYRDNEVNPTHPLIHTLEQIHKTEAKVNQILLRPLAMSHANQLIADTLHCSQASAQPLAELVVAKTGGNAFFLNQLLQTLYQEKLLVFHNPSHLDNQEKQGCFWQWDIEQIQNIGITDNVVDLMVRKIAKLDQNTQNLLKLAACIGNDFNLEILAVVNKKSPIITSQQLQPALKEGLILPLSNDYKLPLLWSQAEISSGTEEIAPSFIPQYPQIIPYKFLHDRVQQAAYSLIEAEEKKVVHLQIGRLLLKNTATDALEENIFKIVNHLNEGNQLIKKQSEKNQLAQLNLQAGKKAKASTAYKSALKYLQTGINLLGRNSWKKCYQLTWDLQIEILELLYFNQEFDQFEQLSAILLEQAQEVLDKAKVNQLKISYYYTVFKPEQAIDTAMFAVKELGLNISQPSGDIAEKIQQHQEAIQIFLQANNLADIENLVSLPVMNDQAQTAIILMLQQTLTAITTTNFPLSIEVLLTLINLSLKYGNSPPIVCIYGMYGTLLCSFMQDINSGDKFGKLAIKLLEKFNVRKLEPPVLHIYYGNIWHWKGFLRNPVALQQLIYGFQTSIDTGDNEFASYLAIDYCWLKFLSGYNLEEVNEDCHKYSKFIQKTAIAYSQYCIEILQNLVINLLRYDSEFDDRVMVGTTLEEEAGYLKIWEESSSAWLLFFAYFGKTVCSYICKNYLAAAVTARNAEKYVAAAGSFLTAPQHTFYASLTLLAYAQICDESNQQRELLEQVDKNLENIKIWAEYCPENFQHKYELLAAEKAKIRGQNWQAQELYERAIQGAKKSEFLHEEAIAYERTAEFYLALGRQEIGQLYLRNAHHCYTRWGAIVKVKQLETEYPQLLIGAGQERTVKSLSTTVSTTGKDRDFLDLATVMKASHALAEEIILSNLLAKLMKIMIENAGAQKGFLLLYSHEQWLIEAIASVDCEDMTILQSLPLDSLDPVRQTPLLSSAIIHYVARSQESVILHDAGQAGQYTRDPYIVATQPKSILCNPLLNQGKLSGILYLENNLTTGAFTPNRVEVLNILSSQAAISIENSRLYATLEQKVEERTQELTQTLEVLKATQAKLEFENALLKSDEQAAEYDYQVGGSLPIDAPTYVVRSADRYLYKALTKGDFCYILNTRQMGKSSLMVRMMHHLQQEELCCAAIDMTRIGNENITPEQWYKGLIVELWQSFDLFGKVNLKAWWQEHLNLSPVQQLSKFLENVILQEVTSTDSDAPPKIIIFFDEIDSVLGLDFPVNDFFALIRSCYNQRSINPEYKRLCFALFGVATPSDLITDYRRTPFNIGQAIQLHGFQPHEAQPLLVGLADKVSNPQAVLKEVLFWTNGQPFLTQKICQMIRTSGATVPEKSEKDWIENLIRTNIIEYWEAQDEPEHLRTIRDRILKGERPPQPMLELYQRVLEEGQVPAVDSPDEKELLLSGLLIKEQGFLKIHNRIYELIFTNSWIEQHTC